MEGLRRAAAPAAGSLIRWSSPNPPAGNPQPFHGHRRLLPESKETGLPMDPVYIRMREHARRIVDAHAAPRFYTDFAPAVATSRRLFEAAPLIAELREFVAEKVDDNFGHGMAHADKVALDAGTLILVEGRRAGYAKTLGERRVLVAQCAGLFHDVLRNQEDHALRGAAYAREVLPSYRLEADEIEDICRAIHNHEAFKEPIAIASPEGRLVSDCLYDADKFRWGPDNFTDTLWSMIACFDPPVETFIRRYPQGLEGLVRIKPTFRTATGIAYGPQFIDLGLAIGRELYQTILTEFAPQA